jgi:hypothetical protein
MGPKIFHASTFNHYGYDLKTVSIVLQKAGDINGTHRQLIYILRTRQYNSSYASAKINVLWKSIKVLLFKGHSHTHILTQHGPVIHKVYDTHTHRPGKHKTNDKQPRQISTKGSKNWLLTSKFEAQNNESDHPILQEKTNSKYNNKFTCVYE